jgi:hypothetical protein
MSSNSMYGVFGTSQSEGAKCIRAFFEKHGLDTILEWNAFFYDLHQNIIQRTYHGPGPRSSY